MTSAEIIQKALEEDIGPGDHTSLACIPAGLVQKAKLLVKEPGILAGTEVAREVFRQADPQLQLEFYLHDGDAVKPGDIAFHITGDPRSILMGERLCLNLMQRMSGIATRTNHLVKLVSHTNVKLLDTRKTTPLLRAFEKEAVKTGGGYNHRFGLYDMIMIKDNHVDFAGGISQAIEKTCAYLRENNLSLRIEIEVRNMEELEQVMQTGNIDRIMLDNFTPDALAKAVQRIDKKYETEASGGITEENIVAYAETGVDYISIGALTHSVKSLDLSLKAVREND